MANSVAGPSGVVSSTGPSGAVSSTGPSTSISPRKKFLWYKKEYEVLKSLSACNIYSANKLKISLSPDQFENYIQVHGFFKDPADDKDFPNNMVFEEIPFQWFIDNGFIEEFPRFEFEGANPGDRFTHPEFGELILANIGNCFKLISLDGGNRLTDYGEFRSRVQSWERFKKLLKEEGDEPESFYREIYKTRKKATIE